MSSDGSDSGGDADGESGGDGRLEDAGTYTVELLWADGRTAEIEVAGDETVLEATDESTIDLRYGCREGRCVSCTARLLRGELNYLTEPESLSDRLREEGFVLLCIARPASDCWIEVGKNVLADAFPGLWRSESGVAYVEELRDAGREIQRLDGDDDAADGFDHLDGALELFDNLEAIQEAYERARRNVDERRIY